MPQFTIDKAHNNNKLYSTLPILELACVEKCSVHCQMATTLIFTMIHEYFSGLEAVTQTVSWPHEGWKFYVTIGGPSARSNRSRDLKFSSQISSRNRKTFEAGDWVSRVFFNRAISGESLFRVPPPLPHPHLRRIPGTRLICGRFISVVFCVW